MMKKLLGTVSLSLVLAINTPLTAMDEDFTLKSNHVKQVPNVVFSLDVGGTPSVGAVRIMELIFDAVQEKLSSARELCSPQEVIDLLIGASNGCNIATMLGFGKTLAEISESIEKDADVIYPQDFLTLGRRLGGMGWKSRYHSQPYEAALQKIYGEKTAFEYAKPPICLTTYCASNGRYYSIDSLDRVTFPDISAWWACRAATGHPNIYTPREVNHKDGPITVQDGITGHIDPTTLAVEKAHQWYSGKTFIFVSIGTGPQSLPKLRTEQGVQEFIPHESISNTSVAEAFLNGDPESHHYFSFRYLTDEVVVPDTIDKDALGNIKKKAEGVKDTPEFARLVDTLIEIIQLRGHQ